MAPPTSFGRDPGLHARMLLTLFLLGVVYAAFVGVLFATGIGAVTIALIAGVLFLLQFLASARIALYAMGAREVSPAQAPELHAIVERLCIQANLPQPRVALAQTPMPNAFAIGRSPKTTTVCATTGLLALLTPGELEGALAHELAHVQNRDVIVMTIASFFGSVASLIVMGFWFGRASGGDGEEEEDSQWRKRQLAVAAGLFFVPVILVSGVVYMVSFVLLQALSRYRELAADRGSAIITGRPSALISALMKIGGSMPMIPQHDLRAAPRELAAFYILPPGARRTVAGIFATHPPLAARIAALQRLEAQLQGTAWRD